MSELHENSPSSSAAGGAFARTHWSVVAAAGSADSSQARAALEILCQAYWKPAYAYVRRRGYSPHDSQDLVQDFFAHLLRSNAFTGLSPEKGRFRSFLLTALKYFLANEWDKANAQKRGGGVKPISIEAAAAESGYLLEPVENVTAEKLFERRWALTLLDRVLTQLETEYQQEDKAALFARLKGSIGGSRDSLPYAELGKELAMSEGAVKVAVHRMRQRYRELLREEISHTVPRPEDIQEEIRALFAALSC